MVSRIRFFALAFLLLASRGLLAAEADKVHFNRDVRPILSNTCFYCHGPDEKHREADLRLDTRDGATANLGDHAAITPGKADASELIQRVTSTDPEVRMPPAASKRAPLTAAEVATLKKWIDQGAEYEAHWAFLPLSDAAPPKVKHEAWVRNPIDRFIVQKLEAEKVEPSPEADRATLIRRVSLDLTGLLPSPDEVKAFIDDRDPQAFDKLVDRLLASPHYGERWARHWLDQARYADSNGYTIDSERTAWPYRDWVIKAVMDDMPFDRFTIEQLAGDLLPNPTKSQMIATSFHRNTPINEEGGVDREQFRHVAIVDRVATTGAVWLGLTVACAQCHTHKFDPISQREYYEFFAFFNQCQDANGESPTAPIEPGEIFPVPAGSIPATAPPPTPQQIARKQEKWERKELNREVKLNPEDVAWQPVEYANYRTKSGTRLRRLDDNSLLADGHTTPNDTYRVSGKTDLKTVAALRLRVLTDDSLPMHGPGLAGNGNFVLSEFRLLIDGKQKRFAWAAADLQQADHTVAGAIDDDASTGWGINASNGKLKMNANHEATFVLDEPCEAPDGKFEVQLVHETVSGYLIGRFSLEVTDKAPAPISPLPAELRSALNAPLARRSPEQAALVQAAFAKYEAAEAKAEKKRKGIELMVMKDLDKPRPNYLFTRGDFLRPDKQLGPLQPGVPRAIPPEMPPSEHRNRLDLARWLVDPKNPLTPRVTVNRSWMRFFGRGIVETDEDFGAQGSPPSHPELLDWLSGEFIRRGWSMKQLHRLIVTSATYRQSSAERPDLANRDARNILLARQSRVRVEAEIVRDAALSASGLLDPTLGGPPVRPPQPEGVYAFTQGGQNWRVDTGSNRYRRAIYTQFYRSAPYPLLTTFDSPDFQNVCTRRMRSDTPLQALTMANDASMLEIAQGLAGRVLREVPADDTAANHDAAKLIVERIRRAALLCYCRQPTAQELETLKRFYDRRLAEFSQNADRAKKLGATPFDPPGTPPEIGAATVSLVRVLLNTDNFITRE